MTRLKSTKKALLLSLLSLLLCSSMFIGTTYAWFTDSVTSGNNIIKSGTLDIDLVDTDGNSLEGKVLTFVDQDDNDLWEPGCTYKLQEFFVENKGGLALKYEIVISGLSGDAALLEAIEWTITVGGNPTTLAQLNGTLLPGQKSEGIILSGHMKDDAKNEYQGLTLDGISVSVFATQYTEEDDSFDDQYDSITLVSDGEELAAAVAAGGNVMLAGDIKVQDLTVTVGSGITTNLYLSGHTLTATSTIANRDGAAAFTAADNYILFLVQQGAVLNLFGEGTVEVCHTAEDMGVGAMTTAAHVYGSMSVTDAEIINHGGSYMAYALNAYTGASVNVKNTYLGSSYIAMRVANYQLGTTTVSFEKSSLFSFNFKPAFWMQNLNNYGSVELFGLATEADAKGSENTVYGAVMDSNASGNFNLWVGGDGKSVYVTDVASLTNALATAANGTTIHLLDDIEGDVSVIQRENVTLTIDGNGHEWKGSLLVSGASRYSSEILTVQNLNFVMDRASEFASIDGNWGTANETRYVHNLTVRDCSFTMTGEARYKIAAVDLYQPYNIILQNCTVTGAHSVLQNKGGHIGITVDGVKAVDCKNGISVGTMDGPAVIKNCNLESVGSYGYGIRADASDAYSLTVKNSKIKAAAPVLLRKASGSYTATFDGNTLTTTADYQLIVTAGDYEEGKALTAPSGTVTLIGADSLNAYK